VIGSGISVCQDKDIPLLFERFKKVYPANPLLQDRKYFDWHYRENPFNSTDDYTFLCSWRDSSINGFIGFSPIEFRFERAIYQGCWVENWYSEEGAVGMALLGQVMSRFDHRLMAGMSSDALPIYQQFKIPLLYKLPRLIGIIDAGRTAARFEISDEQTLSRLSESAVVLEGLQEDPGTTYSRRFSADHEYAFDRWDSVSGFIRRTGRYLNWRYLDIPSHDYQAIIGADDQFAIFRCEKIKGTPDSAVRILEWNFRGESSQGALASILHAKGCSGAILVDFFCTSPEVRSELANMGFVPDTESGFDKIPYLFRPAFHAKGIPLAIDLPPHRKEREIDFDHWYITKGDSDLDRMKL